MAYPERTRRTMSLKLNPDIEARLIALAQAR
jgi:hypothetical protein